MKMCVAWFVCNHYKLNVQADIETLHTVLLYTVLVLSLCTLAEQAF